MAQKKDNGVALARVIAICSIIFTHLCILYNWVTIRAIIVGVPLFIIISGYLFGKRNISSIKDFVLSRWKKIIVPSWIFAGLSFLYASIFLNEKPTLIDITMYTFNLQGLNRLYTKWFYDGFTYCGILWFVTVIFICYMMIPAFQRLMLLERWKQNIVLMCCIGITLVTLAFGIRLHYFWTFYIGYIFAQKDIIFNKKILIQVGLLCATIWTIRIVIRPYLDDTVIYDELIGNYSLDIAALFVFGCIKCFSLKYSTLTNKVINLRIISWIEKNSFFIYLTHYLFFAGIFKASFYTKNVIYQTLIIILGTIPATIILKWICAKVDHIIEGFGSNNK